MHIYHYSDEIIREINIEFKKFFQNQILYSLELVLVDEKLFLSKNKIEQDTAIIKSQFFSPKLFHLIKNSKPITFNLNKKQYFCYTEFGNEIPCMLSDSFFKIYISSDENNYIVLAPM